MQRVVNLYSSSIGKKIVMAVTGFLLSAFVLVHMLGNLKIFQGPVEYHGEMMPKIDAYGHFLREAGFPALGHGDLLWIFRIGLIVLAALHIWSAIAVWRMSAGARPRKYRKEVKVASTWGSRTMRFGGIVLAAFIVFHILHLTTGTIDPAGSFEHGAVKHNMMDSFSIWWVTAFYVISMVFLGLHVHHGIWSAFQTLGVAHPEYKGWRRTLALCFALVVAIGNISIPVAILIGVVQ